MNAREFFGAMFDPFTRLTDFAGRSTRAQFWPFIFLHYAISQIVTLAAMSPFMNRLNALSAAQASGEADPEAVAAVFADGSFADMISTTIWISAAIGLIFLIPLAGAVTRRLHDTDRSGLWALPAFLLLMSGLFMMWRLVAPYLNGGNSGFEVEDFMASILPIFLNNMLYIICVITLIVFCVQDGTIGPNRFGEDPKGRDPGEEAERIAKLAEGRRIREGNRKEQKPARAPARLIK